MLDLNPESTPAALQRETDHSLLRRIRAGLWLLLLGLGAYALVEPFLFPDLLLEIYRYRAIAMAVVACALLLLRGRRANRRWGITVALFTLCVVCVCTAASGAVTGDSATPALVSVILVTVTATMLPWGIGPQAVLVTVSGASTLWTIHRTAGGFPLPYAYPAGAILAVYLGSFYVLRDLAQNRRTMAQEMLERRRAEEKARQREAALAHVSRVSMMGETAAELAHELNQPLSAIVSYARGCVRRMHSGAGASPEIIEALEEISAQAVRASEIIRRLREFVRKGETKRKPTNVNELIFNATRFAEPQAKEYGVKVRFDLTPRLPLVETDAIQIEQVILNLVRNGMEAMHDGEARSPELWIRTTPADDDGGVLVAVRDAGPGLVPEIADRIFDPFFTTKPEGLGMGLSISRSIVEAHGGRLWATANPDGGTTFQFTLPGAGREQH